MHIHVKKEFDENLAGHKIGSIPHGYLIWMMEMPEVWGWVFDDPDGWDRFFKLNPQFSLEHRLKYGQYPPPPKNKDGLPYGDRFDKGINHKFKGGRL